MRKAPKDLKYTKSHEWVRLLDDGSVRIGITDHAQDQLGDMVYVELPDVGKLVASGEECAVVESVKAASDVYSPIKGEVIEVNTPVSETPELVNSDPYGEGWLIRVQPDNCVELDNLLGADDYTALATEH